MRWRPGGRSSNVDDVRGRTGGRGLRAGGIGLGGIAIVVVIGLLTGQNPLQILGSLVESGAGGAAVQTGAPPSQEELAAEEETVQFVSFVLDDAQNTWRQLFQKNGELYEDARLVLFRDAVDSAVRHGPGRDGAVLLPARPAGLHRPELLRRAQAALRRARRLRPGVRHRPRDRPPRPEPARHRAAGPGPAAAQSRARPTICRCAWSSRPTASRASGVTPPRNAISSSRATSRRR